jgi:hypothetical protein
MRPLILLDFDGVLFDSAYEAYQVCKFFTKDSAHYRHDLSFDEFMSFRAQLTDAWQFCRLYQKDRVLRDIRELNQIVPDQNDWSFAERFFAARAEMMKDPEWAKLMSPYNFFYQLRPLLMRYQENFRILSTRNKLSIQRTLEFFESNCIEVYGQEEIREHGSKLAIAKQHRWLENGEYVVYIDDMNSHLEPFENEVNLCLHAGWGYGIVNDSSYTQNQAFQIIDGFLKVAHN